MLPIGVATTYSVPINARSHLGTVDVGPATQLDIDIPVAVLAGAITVDGAEPPASIYDRGVLCLPDWVVNAGGVICASVEFAGGTRLQAFQEIEDREFTRHIESGIQALQTETNTNTSVKYNATQIRAAAASTTAVSVMPRAWR